MNLPEIAAALAAPDTLGDPELDAMRRELVDGFAAIRAGRVEGVEPDDLATLTTIAEAVETIRAESERRLSALAAPTTVAASAAGPTATVARPTLAVLAATAPQAAARPAPRPSGGVTIVGERGERYGSLRDPALVAEVVDSIRSGEGVPGAVRKRLAQARSPYPADRVLGPDAERNTAIVASALGADPDQWNQAIVASGGLCSPSEPRYEVAGVATSSRPVRDALPAFGADRGSVSFVRATGLPAVDASAVSVWDAATDAEPGEQTKTKWVPGCSPIVEVTVQAIVRRLGFGNFQGRAHPEQVADVLDAAIAAQARTAEVELLDAITNGSVDLTEVATLGAARDLLVSVAQAASNLRWRFRMDRRAQLRLILPSFVVDMMQSDTARQQASGSVDALGVTAATVEAWLAARDVRVTWAQDVATGWASPPEPTDGANVPNWPSVVDWLLHPAGQWLFLDAGVLDLGVVRDPDLNATNDYEVFAETFEAVGQVGPADASLHVSSTICANGESQVATDETGSVCAAS